MRADLLLRFLGALALGFIGWGLGGVIPEKLLPSPAYLWLAPLAGAVLGFLIAPYATSHPYRWLREWLRQISPRDLVAGIVGLLLGLLVAWLLTFPLSLLPGFLGRVLPVVAALLLAYVGASLLVMHSRGLFHFLVGLIGGERGGRHPLGREVLVDTSVIIDGRIADISRTGFLPGPLVIPRFVLNELQDIADSPDSLRRNRGRRGLDMLAKLQKEAQVPIQISDTDFEDIPNVDGKLVAMAKVLHVPILTNDFNLNRVAELQGIQVLNINLLTNAIKAVVLPGEEMALQIIQEGKEVGQGVGFLDDGTMVVVDGGRRFLHQQLDIVVTRVLTTASGRMIFAQPKNGGASR